jgi:hypothetical protein
MPIVIAWEDDGNPERHEIYSKPTKEVPMASKKSGKKGSAKPPKGKGC